MLLYILISFVAIVIQVDALHHLQRPPPYLSKREISINAHDYPAIHIDIPIDHYNASDTRTYKNRYWVNLKYYKAGGPVFYFDGGEQNAHPLVP